MAIVEPARAKLNLALHVRARRADGYHELDTLFAFVGIGDQLRLEDADADRFDVTGPFAAGLAGEGDNLVTRALASFRAAFALHARFAITLDKRLPVSSGIGGGSTDAAATLRALAIRFGIDLGAPELMSCAKRLGSDVPACLIGRTAEGKGRGERLQIIDGLPGAPVLLVNPGVAVSTAGVFATWDGIDRGPIGDGPLLQRVAAGRNDLEAPARRLAPVIGDVLAMLAAGPGTDLARMSGSGATCFAMFDGVEARGAAATRIRAAQPDWWCVETELV